MTEEREGVAIGCRVGRNREREWAESTPAARRLSGEMHGGLPPTDARLARDGNRYDCAGRRVPSVRPPF